MGSARRLGQQNGGVQSHQLAQLVERQTRAGNGDAEAAVEARDTAVSAQFLFTPYVVTA